LLVISKVSAAKIMNLFAGKLSVNKKTGFEKLRTGFNAFKCPYFTENL
jgi:hypothetical protein